jgi:3-mercaptopropionate dioxygenase
MVLDIRSQTNRTLASLIEGVHGVVRGGGDPEQVAAGVADVLAEHLDVAELLRPEQCEPDPNHYRQHVLHAEDDGSFSIVALVWLPGQATPIHDHVSWCVVGVHRGEELETLYVVEQEAGGAVLVETDQVVNPTGSVAALTPPGDIHRVTNRGSGLAISLHVYGADIRRLGSSIRRSYDLPVRGEERSGPDAPARGGGR